jgi:hypothetical protein
MAVREVKVSFLSLSLPLRQNGRQPDYSQLVKAVLAMGFGTDSNPEKQCEIYIRTTHSLS